MVCTIKRRSDEVIHTGIHDEEVLGLAALDEKYSRNQRRALGDKRTSWLHMHRLILAAGNIFRYCPEPCLEIRNCILVRIVIINSETTSEVDVVHLQSLVLKIPHDVVDSLALKGIYLIYSCDLGSDMEVEAYEIDAATAAADVSAFLAPLREANLIEN